MALQNSTAQNTAVTIRDGFRERHRKMKRWLDGYIETSAKLRPLAQLFVALEF